MVEDDKGKHWVRLHPSGGQDAWHDGTPFTARLAYSDITAVRVLSEGVTP